MLFHVLIMLFNEFLSEYLFLKYDQTNLTNRESTDVIREIESDEEKYWKMMKAVRRYYWIRKMVLKKCDISKMSACELLNTIKGLWEIEDEDSFQTKLALLPRKAE